MDSDLAGHLPDIAGAVPIFGTGKQPKCHRRLCSARLLYVELVRFFITRWDDPSVGSMGQRPKRCLDRWPERHNTPLGRRRLGTGHNVDDSGQHRSHGSLGELPVFGLGCGRSKPDVEMEWEHLDRERTSDEFFL